MNENPLFRGLCPQTFMGIRVAPTSLVQPVPKIQISPKFEWCTHEFRADYNSWLLERFGTVGVAYFFDPRMLGMTGDRTLFMNPKHVAMLKNFAE